ncbi:MAG: hypothetical protein KFB96_00580 [Thiocapsa sp.]|uniref:hypothetical protein n=1 Tax=Thiocapsa sp. TaxID=2024551 RepID=UPI001BCB9D6B|nr:hypothetical protein [Thiocapsa sp.]QVL49072.1 MAG: hypothetical protein KFB96_00580 [Thiocapsa sp.]
MRKGKTHAFPFFVFFALISGCAHNSSATSNDDFNLVMSGYGVEQVTDKRWLACARKAVEAAENEMRQDGIESNFWGAAGSGMIFVATEDCGYLESPKIIPNWAMDVINEKCYLKPDAVQYEIFKRPFYKYHPDYLEKTVMPECRRVYESQTSQAKRNAEKSRRDAEKPQLALGNDERTFANATKDDWRTKCQNIANLAETIMRGRQVGLPMAKLIELSEGNAIAESFVISAYDLPRYLSESMRQRSTDDFRDQAYLACSKVYRPK